MVEIFIQRPALWIIPQISIHSAPPSSVIEAVYRSMEQIVNYPDVQCRKLCHAIAEHEYVKERAGDLYEMVRLSCSMLLQRP